MPLRGADSGILDEVDIHTGRAILGLSGPFRNALRVTVSLYAAKKSITALQRRHCCSGLQCHRLVGVTLHRRPTYEKSATLWCGLSSKSFDRLLTKLIRPYTFIPVLQNDYVQFIQLNVLGCTERFWHAWHRHCWRSIHLRLRHSDICYKRPAWRMSRKDRTDLGRLKQNLFCVAYVSLIYMQHNVCISKHNNTFIMKSKIKFGHSQCRPTWRSIGHSDRPIVIESLVFPV